MTADEFKAGLIRLWGADYHAAAQAAFDVDASTLRRWANGRSARVPGPAGRLLEHLLVDEERKAAQRASVRAYKAKRKDRTGA